MAGGQFVWVNKTHKSDSLSNNYTDFKTRYEINSHVQNRRKQGQSHSSGGTSSPESAAESIARYIRRSSSQDLLSKSSVSRRVSNKRRKLTREDALPSSKPRPLQLNPRLVGNYGSLDPFDSLSVRIDANAHSLMHFYVHYTSLCPMAWDSEPYKSNDSGTSNNKDVLSTHMSNKLQYYTFLTLTAAVKEMFGVKDQASRYGRVYSHHALREIRSRLLHESTDEEELIYGISRLFLSAVLQSDEFGARAHIGAAKFLIDKAGGLDMVQPSTAVCIRYGDLHLAVETLSAPLFPLASDPGCFNEPLSSDPSLGQLRRILLQLSQIHLPPTLQDGLESVMEWAMVLESTWVQPTTFKGRSEWMASRAGAILTQVLEADCSDTNFSCRKEWEAFKVTTILWIQILVLVMNQSLGAASIKGNILTFSNAKLDSMRAEWPPCLSSGLQEWNATVEFYRAQHQPESKTSFLRLVYLVKSIEAESAVQLGPFIDQLLYLRQYHQSV